MIKSKKEKLNQLNLLFRQMKKINDELIDDAPTNEAYEKEQMQSEDKRLLIRKAYLFYISSFGLSYIKNLYLQNANTLGNIMNIRCANTGAWTSGRYISINSRRLFLTNYLGFFKAK